MSSPRPWSLRLVKAVFFNLFVFIGIAVCLGLNQPAWIGALSGAGFMGCLLLLDRIFDGVTMREFSHGTFGLLIGLFCAWLVTRVGISQLTFFQGLADGDAIIKVVEIAIYGALAFFGVTFALRSERDAFALVIPYVRFRRDSSEGEPVLLDSSVVIDGRLEAVVRTGFVTGLFVLPRLILDELQRLADSRDALKSERGKRGLDQVRRLREQKDIEIVVHEEAPRNPADTVDSMLVSLARELNARLMTNDENLTQVARLRGIQVLNFNELGMALQNQLAPGDELSLNLSRPGKDKGQAVGYLADGTMIVVNQAIEHLGSTVQVRIMSALPTTAGRLFFAELLPLDSVDYAS